MAINSNLSIYHPTKLGEYLLQLQYPAHPLVGMSATAPIGQNIAGTLSTGGKTVDVNKAAKPGQSAVKSYSGTYTPNDPDGSQESLTIDNHQYVNFTIDKADARLSPINLVNNHVRPFYEELLQKVNDDVKGAYNKGNAAFTDFNSGATVMDNEDITEAKRILKERQFVKNDLVAVVDANGEKDLTDLSLFHQANTGANGAMLQRNGMLARKFGFDIFVDDQANAQTVGFDADAQVAEAGEVGEVALDLEDGGAAALETAPAEGEVVYFGSATGTDQFYVVDSGSTTSLVNLKEGLRDAVTDNTAMDGLAGSNQYFFKRGAVALVTLGMQSVSQNSPGVERAVVFDPVNRINFTLTITETKSGADILMEALYGYQTFYPDWICRYIRGTAAKA